MAGSLGQLDLIGTMATQPIRRMRGTPLNQRVFLTGTCQARFQSRTAATWTLGKEAPARHFAPIGTKEAHPEWRSANRDSALRLK
jgi:hypothetical protein